MPTLKKMIPPHAKTTKARMNVHRLGVRLQGWGRPDLTLAPSSCLTRVNLDRCLPQLGLSFLRWKWQRAERVPSRRAFK
jgi:hypothetical protein